MSGDDDASLTATGRRGARSDRLYSPSVARNAGAIVDAWPRLLPSSGTVLEVASGTGEHAARLCAAFTGLDWYPSDPDAPSRASIASWARTVPGGRMRAPLDLDVTAFGWWDAAPAADGVFCANMVHIAPPAAAEGLLRGAAIVLRRQEVGTEPTGALALYGPFSRRGVMAPSNHRFDASLKARDPAFGVRDLDDDLQPLAARFGLALTRVEEMPANNLFVAFEPN